MSEQGGQRTTVTVRVDAVRIPALAAAGALASVVGGIGPALALLALAGAAAAPAGWAWLPETRVLDLEAIAP